MIAHSKIAKMEGKYIFYLLILVIISFSNLFFFVMGEIRDNSASGLNRTSSNVNFVKNSNFTANLLNTLKSRRKDKKNFVNKKLKRLADTENLKELINQLDSTGAIRRIFKRRAHLPEGSELSLTSQVSRPNIFPNIFNQGEGFIVDAVIEWALVLDLHLFGKAFGGHHVVEGGGAQLKMPIDGEERNETNPDFEPLESNAFEGKSFSDPTEVLGLERCLIYEKVETGMSTYLDIPKNQSRDCVLRAVCEAQLVADYYPDAPSSVFFEFAHLVLKPSLGPARDPCYEDYLNAEKAAYKEPDRCSSFKSKCPLNMAGLFVRNFFPEIL